MLTRASVTLVVTGCLALIALTQPAPPRDTQGQNPSQATPRVEPKPRPDLRHFLRTKIEKVEFDEAPFDEVIAWLRERGRVNIVVRWRVLEKRGIERNTPVSLRLEDVTAAQLLSEVLDYVSVDTELRYVGIGNILRISTREDLNRKMYVKVYPVDDLIHDIPDFISGGFGGTEGLARAAGAGGATGPREIARTPEEHLAELIEAIQETIEPGVWRINGGQATIHSFKRRVLVVRAPLEVHEKLGGPLFPTER